MIFADRNLGNDAYAKSHRNRSLNASKIWAGVGDMPGSAGRLDRVNQPFAVKTSLVGDGDAIETAQAFADASIVPVQYEGWMHFKQNGDDLQTAFKTLGFEPRLRMLRPGIPTVIEAAS